MAMKKKLLKSVVVEKNLMLSILEFSAILPNMHIPNKGRTKLDDKSHKCVFLGVSEESKAYMLYDSTTKKVIVSRDVVFDENKG